MHLLALAVGLAVAPTLAKCCTPDSSGISIGVLHNHTISVSGQPENSTHRSYLLWIPESYASSNKPAPVILSYHGGGQTAFNQSQLDLLTSSYFNSEYIVVYPQGIGNYWQGVPGVPSRNDTAFTAAILNRLERDYCVDSGRIFATGKSQGAGFVGNGLACDAGGLSVRIRAFAPVSGAFYEPNNTDDGSGSCTPATVPIACEPGRADVPVLEFHGGADGTIDYNGGVRRGGCLPTIPHWIQEWALRDGLGETNTSFPLTLENGAVATDATVYEFGSGEERGLVTHIFDGEDVNHSWPATIPNHDNELHKDGPASFNATSIILEFFAKW